MTIKHRSLLPNPRLGLGDSRKPAVSARLVLIVLQPALLLFATWVSSAACSATQMPTRSGVRPPSTLAFCDQGCAIADLDGDGHPDLAIAKAEGRGTNGYRYQVDLDLTTGAGPSSFSVFAQSGGLLIVPRDVDGDWDVDLVISSARTLAPVGVWINDGHGGFIRSSPTAYTRSGFTGGLGILCNPPQETFQATVPEFSRSWAGSSAGISFSSELIMDRLVLPSAAVNPPANDPRRPQTRGPPFP